ncbi:hypothetical protein ACP70R_042973 [Stipagrostis hirtigluma subsp. patula]
MKFGKSLSNQVVETLPEWRDKFLSYKDLKKRLKLLAGAGDGERRSKRQRGADGSPVRQMTAEEEAGFVALLEAELDKFNAFFLEKEEEYVIRQKELQDRVVRAAEAGSPEELMRVRKEIVDFHGEMVLLQNYSTLNYTVKDTELVEHEQSAPLANVIAAIRNGRCHSSKQKSTNYLWTMVGLQITLDIAGLVKILKKYDKRTGALIRLPFIQNVLQQPFFTTDLLYQLVKECEAMLDQLVPRSRPSVPSEDARDDSDGDGDDKPPKPGSGSSLANGGGGVGVPELEENEEVESTYMKSTVAALRALKEIRSGSSTVSAFSLPPLHAGGEQQEEREM